MQRIVWLWHTLSMQFEWQLAWAYWRGRRAKPSGNGFISFIALLSVLGIALGVAALITVLSVMNGFQKEVRNRMLSVVSHLELHLRSDPQADDQAMRDAMAKHPAVLGMAAFEPLQVLITRDDSLRAALIRGISPADEAKVSSMVAAMPQALRESLRAGAWRIILGRELARSLGVVTGDRLVVIAPDLGNQGTGFAPRMRQFEVVGVFESGHYEYDSALAASELAQQLDDRYELRDWSQENRVWFEAVQVEKRMMFIILTLIVAVASFNLVSMLVMTVVDKRADIAILRSMGAGSGSVMRIFMLQGLASGGLGTALGVALGLCIVSTLDSILRSLEQIFAFEVLPKGVLSVAANSNRLASG